MWSIICLRALCCYFDTVLREILCSLLVSIFMCIGLYFLFFPNALSSSAIGYVRVTGYACGEVVSLSITCSFSSYARYSNHLVGIHVGTCCGEPPGFVGLPGYSLRDLGVMHVPVPQLLSTPFKRHLGDQVSPTLEFPFEC